MGREAFGIGQCPHHDALPATAASAGGDDGDPAAGHDHTGTAHRHAGSGHDHTAARHAAGSHDPSHHSGACTCLGDCQAGATGAILTAAAPESLSAGAGDASPAPEDPAALPGPTPYALPFAHAPPAGY